MTPDAAQKYLIHQIFTCIYLVLPGEKYNQQINKRCAHWKLYQKHANYQRRNQDTISS